MTTTPAQKPVVRAFPWSALDAIAREDVSTVARLGALAGRVELASLVRVLEELVHAPLVLRARRIEPTAGPSQDDAIAVAMTLGASTIVVEVEVTLACDVVARAVGKEPPPIVTSHDAAALHPFASAFGALLLKAVRRTTGEGDVRVTTAGAGHVVLGAAAIADPAAIGFTVTVDADAYRGRVIFSRRLAPAAPPPFDGSQLARAGDVKLAIPLVLASVWATLREMQSLERGDVLVTQEPWSAGARTLALAGARATRGVPATLEDGGRLVLGTSSVDLTMSDAAQDTIIESALDAPVVIRVEVGAVELTAREWAGLAPGDVVATGTRIGSSVVLRAGGAEVGLGELVDIDGNVGVRITSLGKRA